MLRTFRYLFNALRNVSLACVVLSLAYPIGVSRFSNVEKIDESVESHEENGSDASTFSMFAAEDRTAEIGLLPGGPAAGKLLIEVPGGTAYLLPEQIMYVNSGNRLEIFTTTNDTLEATLRLYALEELLERSSPSTFFKIRTAIVNCGHIQQLIRREVHPEGSRYYYKYYIVMSGGTEIPVFEPRFKELAARMRGRDS